MTQVNARMARAALGERMERAFQDAASERERRQDFVTLPDGRQELGWVIHERLAMWAEVNQARAERGLNPVLIEKITRAENLAAGHVDYATKFPFYCAEVVLGER